MSKIFVNEIATTGNNNLVMPSGVKMPAGMIIQTVQTVSRTSVNSSSSSYAEASTNFRCSITPKFSNSKLLITATLGMTAFNNGGQDCSAYSQLYDVTNGAYIANSETPVREIDYGGSGNSFSNAVPTILLVDFQNANQHTITWYYKKSAAITVQANDDHRLTQIMLQEIKQ